MQSWLMASLTARKTAPFTEDEAVELAAFVAGDTPEHEVLEQLTPVPLREGSEGSAIRALVLIGMRTVRDRIDAETHLAAGYEALAASRTDEDRAVADGMRRNMARLASRG